MGGKAYKYWKVEKIHEKYNIGQIKKQMTGIEPASSAWEADVLPMNYICNIEIIPRLWIKVNIVWTGFPFLILNYKI